MKIYDIHIDAYCDATAQPVLYVASCDELPGLALGAESRVALVEKVARALPGILGALGRSQERARCRFIYERGVTL